MKKFDFFFALNLSQRIFSHTDNLSETLQKASMSATSGQHNANLTKDALKKIRNESMAPDPPRTLAPAARAKNVFGILFSPPPPNHKNAARTLHYSNYVSYISLVKYSPANAIKISAAIFNLVSFSTFEQEEQHP